MRLKQLLNGLDGFSLVGNLNRNVTQISDDSRNINKNSLFCAIKGIRSNGHAFINEAIENGAGTIIVEKVPRNLDLSNICVIKVKDSRDALGVIASNFNGNPSKRLKVIGVTGTKGKTTTAHFIYQILTRLGKNVGLVSSISAKIGNKNIDTGFHVTNPDCISLHSLLKKMVKKGCEFAVVEVSSHGIHQKRISGVFFYISVLTNIASEHLDYHKTFENYRDVKLSFLKSSENVVLNADDPNYLFIRNKIGNSKKRLSYSLKGDANFNIDNVPSSSRLEGNFNVLNCLAAVSAVSLCGFELKKINLAVSTLKLPEGRLEEVKNNRGIKIIVDFAHTPDSLENVLKYLKKSCKGKLVAVFGCAGERDPFKRPKMGKIASEIADFVVLTAEDPRSENVNDIILQIRSGVASNNLGKIIEVADRIEAIKFALSNAKKGDIIGFFGKGHEKSMNLDGKTELPWSDRKHVEEALRNI